MSARKTSRPRIAETELDRLLAGIARLEERLRVLDLRPVELTPLRKLTAEARNLSLQLVHRQVELQKLNRIALRINSGLTLEDILEDVYNEFHEIIPYNRIGFSLIEKDGQSVRAHWAHTDQPLVRLEKDYEASLHGSSLEKIIATGRPRILNDLPEYLRLKPGSESTQLVVEEGMRSSLTCPLIVEGKPVGFMFFSSIELNAYAESHVSIFQQIAAQLSILLEKGKLVSELASQKKRIELQNNELTRLNDLKNTFLGIAAHDLRNPLANIQMITDLLSSDDNPLNVNESIELVSDIHRQTEYMLALLSDILDVTQIESGKLELITQEIDSQVFLEEIVERHDKLAEYKHTHVVLDPMEKGRICADKLRLRQVLDNLISNAVKFSPERTTVHVRAAHLGKEWRIEVSDQGPGISEQDRKRLFKDFARLSAQPTAGEKSTGLGLAICKRIIVAHAGQIGVESEPGHGATFWFTLPD